MWVPLWSQHQLADVSKIENQYKASHGRSLEQATVFLQTNGTTTMDQFQAYSTDIADVRPFPLAVPNAVNVCQQCHPGANEATQGRMPQIKRSPSPDTESSAMEKESLEKENQMLKQEIAYLVKLESRRKTLFQRLRSISESFQQALSQFGHDQKAIDQEFLRATQF
jgi:hypothetical protein